MIPYWILFLLPAMMALTSRPTGRVRRDGTRFSRFDGLWAAAFLGLTVMIGFRYSVGGDWGAYYVYLDDALVLDFWANMRREDPGYRLINEFSLIMGWGIQGVNTISAALFAWGLIAFCRSLPRPWLALTVAVPYLVIVVSMGYTRQSIAIGLVMVGLIALSRQKFVKFIFWVLLAALFHKSAVILLPIVALTTTRNRSLIVLLVAVTGAIGYQVVLADKADRLITHYIEAGYQSSGALIRLGMNVVPAALLLFYRKRIRLSHSEYRVWALFSLLSLAMFAAFFVTSASTALDRVALYMIPLQIFLFAHLPDLMGRYGKMNQGIVFMILGYYASILMVWLTLGNFSRAWLPYRFAFSDLSGY